MTRTVLRRIKRRSFTVSLISLTTVNAINSITPLRNRGEMVIGETVGLVRDPSCRHPNIESLVKSVDGVATRSVTFQLTPYLGTPNELGSGNTSLPLVLLLRASPLVTRRLTVTISERGSHHGRLRTRYCGTVERTTRREVTTNSGVLILYTRSTPDNVTKLLTKGLGRRCRQPTVIFYPGTSIAKRLLLANDTHSVRTFRVLRKVAGYTSSLIHFNNRELTTKLAIRPAGLSTFERGVGRITRCLARRSVGPFVR